MRRSLGGGVEDVLEIVAEAHVEHLIGLVEHGGLECREVERAAFEMVAQTPGGADDDVRAVVELAALLRGVHAADAGGDARAGGAVEPDQLAADLEREFTRGGDDEGERLAAGDDAAVLADQVAGHCEAEGDGLARAGLGGDDEVAALGFGFEDGGLDGRGRGIITRGERFGEKRGEVLEFHGTAHMGAEGVKGKLNRG